LPFVERGFCGSAAALRIHLIAARSINFDHLPAVAPAAPDRRPSCRAGGVPTATAELSF